MIRRISIIILLVLSFPAFVWGQGRWYMSADDNSIVWDVDKAGNLPHYDHIEMSGRQVSVVLRYGVDAERRFCVEKSMVWPMLRTLPNDTHASLMRRFAWDGLDAVTVNGRSLKAGKTETLKLDGILRVESSVDNGWRGRFRVIREYSPAVDAPALVENYMIINTWDYNLGVEIPCVSNIIDTPQAWGVDGSYRIEMGLNGAGDYVLAPGDTLCFGGYIRAAKAGTDQSGTACDSARERAAREELVTGLQDNLVLHTPDEVINRMFAFSKIRACESIYETSGGPMHGPGGESYYAAIWANDQAEYINPYFPYTGYEYGNASALNSYRHFARFMNDEYKPLPSSIIAEGKDIWAGVGDRGDAAMIAYGASRFALSSGREETAEELWNLIKWCLEYCRRNLNENGVVASDTDELENRFESGDANLCTSSLYYDALLSAAYISDELGKGVAKTYRRQAAVLRKNIGKHFGRTVEGFDTYRYYDGNEILRSWICIPLTVGIDERKDGTLDALFSPRLWTEDGLLTEAGSETFWDRSTLYALRGAFAAGETERALPYLKAYSGKRLLGEHVPYAIEAWPEGGQRHLSAESGLYGRIITEGLFGIRPVGFKSFDFTPHLPSEWDAMSLRHIRAFAGDFDIEVERTDDGKLSVKVISGGNVRKYSIKDGDTVRVRLVEDKPYVPGELSLVSSIEQVGQTFDWARHQALLFAHDDSDPVGYWYEAALPERYAFCMRDVSHQTTGAQILGLDKHNLNMLGKFAEYIAESRDWCSYWEIDKWNRPAPVDYADDKDFWYNLNANFDVMQACLKMYQWTGDEAYLKDSRFKRFYEKTMHEYMTAWDLSPDRIMSRTPTGTRRGIASYVESFWDMRASLDLMSALIAGCKAYEQISRLNGDSAGAAYGRQCAQAYSRLLDGQWWNESQNAYYNFYHTDGRFSGGGESVYLIWFDATDNVSRLKATAENCMKTDTQWNMENKSYMPAVLYRYGYDENAFRYMNEIPGVWRSDYPEASYGVIEGLFRGMMGIEPVFSEGRIETRSHIPESGMANDYVTVTDVPVFGGYITLTHTGRTSSEFTNHTGRPVIWRAAFAGTHGRIKVNGRSCRAVAGKDLAGNPISYIDVKMPDGSKADAHL